MVETNKKVDELIKLLSEHDCHRVINLLKAYGPEYVVKEICDNNLIKVQDIFIDTFKELEKFLETLAHKKEDSSFINPDEEDKSKKLGLIPREKPHL